MTNSITTKDFFQSEKVVNKFEEVLHDKAKPFITSVLSVVNDNKLLQKANPQTIMSAAMTAATLNLPIQPSLGFAYIVPYRQNGQNAQNAQNTQNAQFQIGYKGLIQLAIRSGQITSINADKVYQEQFISYNPLFGELNIDFTKDHKKGEKPIGYFAAFSLVNGFKKVTYWTRQEVEEHAKRFSKSFKNGPWNTDFDAMARKTVLKSIMSTYAPLTTEMETAFTADNEDFEETGQSETKANKLTEKFANAIPVEEPPAELPIEELKPKATAKPVKQENLMAGEALENDKNLPF